MNIKPPQTIYPVFIHQPTATTQHIPYQLEWQQCPGNSGNVSLISYNPTISSMTNNTVTACNNPVNSNMQSIIGCSLPSSAQPSSRGAGNSCIHHLHHHHHLSKNSADSIPATGYFGIPIAEGCSNITTPIETQRSNYSQQQAAVVIMPRQVILQQQQQQQQQQSQQLKQDINRGLMY